LGSINVVPLSELGQAIPNCFKASAFDRSMNDTNNVRALQFRVFKYP
jgi:hypothetical protein